MLADLRLVIAAPMLGALIVLLAPEKWARWIGVAAAAVGLVAAVASVLAEPAGLAVAWAWIPALGLRLALGIDGIAAPGVLVTCLVGQVAVLLPGSRGVVAGVLMLQATVLAMVLATDLGLLVGCHMLLAPLVAALVAGGRAADRLRAAQAAGLYLALGTAALAVAVGLVAVGHHDASGGQWDLALPSLAAVLLPRAMEFVVGGLCVLGGALTLGLWPLHGWLVAAGAAAPTSAGLMIAGPVRWAGAYLLVRLWLTLTPDAAAAAGFGVATLAVVGAVVGGLCARAEGDARRALLLATQVPAGLLVLGLAGQHHEGIVGAQVLAVVVALGGAAGLMVLAAGGRRWLAGLALVPAPMLAACVGAALVLIGTARFTALTLAGRGWWLALAGGVALVVAIRAMADATGRKGQGASDMSPETESGWRGLVLAGVLAGPLVVLGVWPGPALARLGAASRAVVEAAALRRCTAQALGVTAPTRMAEAPIDACAQPLRALEQRAAEEAG